MEMKVGLTFACMNLKKLARIKQRMGLIGSAVSHIFSIIKIFSIIQDRKLYELKSKYNNDFSIDNEKLRERNREDYKDGGTSTKKCLLR